MPIGFWLGLALLIAIVGLVYALIRLSGKMAREEEQHKAEQRQTEARETDQERAHDIAIKADEAAAVVKKEAVRVSGDGPALADRLRRSGRNRATKD